MEIPVKKKNIKNNKKNSITFYRRPISRFGSGFDHDGYGFISQPPGSSPSAKLVEASANSIDDLDDMTLVPLPN